MVVAASAVAASAVVVSTVAVSEVVASKVPVSMAAGSVVVVSTRDVLAVALSTAVAFVGDVLAVAVSTAVAFVATVLVMTDSLMMSSSAASAFRDGGAGAIPTDIMITAITPMVMTTIHMVMAITQTVTLDTASMVITVTALTDVIIRAEITRA